MLGTIINIGYAFIGIFLIIKFFYFYFVVRKKDRHVWKEKNL